MITAGIHFVLIYIDEAHSSRWPVGLQKQPEPHSSFADRLNHATDFVLEHQIDVNAFSILVDDFSNSFANNFHAWPDQYYLLDSKLNILMKSMYGAESEAKIDLDCLNLIQDLIVQHEIHRAE